MSELAITWMYVAIKYLTPAFESHFIAIAILFNFLLCLIIIHNWGILMVQWILMFKLMSINLISLVCRWLLPLIIFCAYSHNQPTTVIHTVYNLQHVHCCSCLKQHAPLSTSLSTMDPTIHMSHAWIVPRLKTIILLNLPIILSRNSF